MKICRRFFCSCLSIRYNLFRLRIQSSTHLKHCYSQSPTTPSEIPLCPFAVCLSLFSVPGTCGSALSLWTLWFSRVAGKWSQTVCASTQCVLRFSHVVSINSSFLLTAERHSISGLCTVCCFIA